MFVEVPRSFCGTRLWFSFPSVFVDFLSGDLERSLTRLRGSTAADSPSVYIGTRTGACSRDLDLCRLPESSSAAVNGSWITIGCIGGTGSVCDTGIGGVCDACAEGCTRSRNLDRCRCLPSCGDRSSSTVIDIVIVIAHAMLLRLWLFLSNQQGGNPGGSPGESGSVGG